MIISFLTVTFQPGKKADGLQAFSSILADTRAFKGCVSVEVIEDIAAGDTVHLIERWDTLQDHADYNAYRAADGAAALASVGALLAGRPSATIGEVNSDV